MQPDAAEQPALGPAPAAPPSGGGDGAGRGGVFWAEAAARPAPPALKRRQPHGGAVRRGAMAGDGVFLALLAAALVLAGAVLGGPDRPRLVGGPVDIANPDNDEGLDRALRFAMAEYNKASNDMYSSRVVRIIGAKRQVGAGAARPLAGTGWEAAGGQREARPAGCLFGKSRPQAEGVLKLVFFFSPQRVNKSLFFVACV